VTKTPKTTKNNTIKTINFLSIYTQLNNMEIVCQEFFDELFQEIK
ncbi:MAG: hypothetical protein UR56_C0010G0018, partial [Candidatus Roizmanbacteria bacterium GW2011_GWC2_34_23]